MKTSESQVLKEAVSALKGCLSDVPFCKLEREELSRVSRAGPDWKAKLRLPGGQRLLILQAKSSGQPRIVRDAVNQLLRWASQHANSLPVFAAPYISPAAADILTREGVGYLDLCGNCRLAFDAVYIRREDWPNKQTERRDLRSLYSPKAERVLRVLLLEPKRQWKVQELAEVARVSLGQASNVKLLLEDREWIGRAMGDGTGPADGTGFGHGSGSGAGFGDGSGDGSGSRFSNGIIVIQPGKLLEEWAANYRFARNAVRDFYALDAPAQVEAKLATVCRDAGTEYALTGFSAAARLAPMVRYQRASVYVVGNADDIARRLGLKAVSSGANVSLIEPYDEGVLTGGREADGIRIVSAVQVYLDLLSLAGRGEEAAQAILEQVIKPQW